MTARQIIEARLGRALPPTRELPRDLQVAIRELGKQLIRSKRHEAVPLSIRRIMAR